MAVVRTQAGAQSVTFYANPDLGEIPVTQFDISVEQWAVLPAGKLKDLLNRKYTKVVDSVTVVDPAAFMAAYSAAGAFQVTSAYDTTEVEDSYWFLSPGPSEEAPALPALGYPILRVFTNIESPAGTSARVTCSYSASE